VAVRVLVTGAGGVVGRNLVAVLRGNDHTVFAATRQSGADVFWDLNSNDCPEPNPQVETVIHAAAKRGHYGGDLSDASELFETNVLGTLRVAQWCRARKAERLILISGAIVYGQWDKKPKTETDIPIPWAAGVYAVSKYCGELAAMLLSQRGCKVTVLRLSSLYGPEYRNSLIDRLLQQGRSEGRIVLSPPVDDAFDLLHVDDAVRAILKVLQRPRDGTFNVGGGGIATLGQIAGLCAEILGTKLVVKSEQQPRAPRLLNWVDDTAARAYFGHTNQIDLPTGIASIASAAFKESCKT
jgi:UDP-glucose 4-epimerase